MAETISNGSPFVAPDEGNELSDKERVILSAYQIEGHMPLYFFKGAHLSSFPLEKMINRKLYKPADLRSAMDLMVDEYLAAKEKYASPEWRRQNFGSTEFLEYFIKKRMAWPLHLRPKTKEDRSLFLEVKLPMRAFGFRVSDYILDNAAPAGCWLSLSRDNKKQVVWRNAGLDLGEEEQPLELPQLRENLRRFHSRWSSRIFHVSRWYALLKSNYEILGEADEEPTEVSDENIIETIAA